MDSQVLTAALIKKNLLTKEAGEQILKESAVSQKPVEDLLYLRRTVAEEKVAEVKSEITGISYQKTDPKLLTDDLLSLIPKETVQNYKVAPLSRTKDMLVVGMVDPQDNRAQEALKFIAKANRLNLGVYIITPSDLELILRRYNPYKSEIEAAVKSLGTKPGEGLSALQRPVALEEAKGVAEEAPIIRLVASTFREAVERKASDIHVEPMRNRVRVRFRIDGDLEEAASLPIELQQPLVSRIKILSDLKIDETRVPQDGRFRTVIFGRDIDFRVATFPTPMGEKVALRVLDPSIGLKGIDNLGIIGKNADTIKEGIQKPFGMVLVTGPTGSGKTTTLYSILGMLNRPEVNIVTIEDPIEYDIKYINQTQINPQAGITFATGLRSILRQDPNVIMVGEIRDEETASISVQSALTGHLVLSSLHTNDAPTVIPRLIDMKVPAFLTAAVLNAIVAQRLVRKICTNCIYTLTPSPELVESLRRQMKELGLEELLVLPKVIYAGRGCPVCGGSGYRGRMAIFEVLNITEELRKIVVDPSFSLDTLKNEAKKEGMISMFEDGLRKAERGLTTIDELLRVIRE